MANRIDLTGLDLPGTERWALGSGEESKWYRVELPPGARRLAIKCSAAFYVRHEQRNPDGSYPASIAGTAISTSSRTVGSNGLPSGGDPYCLLPAAATEDMLHEFAVGPARARPGSPSSKRTVGGAVCPGGNPTGYGPVAPEDERGPVLYVASATASAVFTVFVQGGDYQ